MIDTRPEPGSVPCPAPVSIGADGSVGAVRLAAPGITLIAVCYGLARFAYGLFVPDFRVTFDLSGTLLGVIAAGSCVGYCVAIVIAGIAVPRFGSRAVAGAAGTVAATGTAMVAIAPDAGTLAAGVLLAGSSTGLASPPLAEAVARWVPSRVGDRVQAVINTGTGPGIVISGIVTLLVAGNWRTVWGGFAVIAVLVTVWTVAAIPAGGSAARVSGGRTGPFAIAVDRRARRLIVGALLYGVASTAVWTFGRELVATGSGLSDTGSVVFWIVVGAAQLIGLVAAGLVARLGLRSVWIATLLVLGGSTVAIGLVPHWIGPAFAAAAGFGAAYLLLTAVVLLWSIRLFPRQVAAAVVVGFLALAAGQALGSPAVGLVADLLGPSAAFVLCGGLAGLAAVLAAPPPAPVRASTRA